MRKRFKKAGKGVLHGNVRICILMFADDIVLIAENRLDLQLLMDITLEYSRKWRFNFNYEKSAVVIFGQVQRETRDIQVPRL